MLAANIATAALNSKRRYRGPGGFSAMRGFSGNIGVGSTGPDSNVAVVQGMLNQIVGSPFASQFGPLAVDGALNSDTIVRLREFQQQYGLPITGQIDNATLQALGLGPMGPLQSGVTGEQVIGDTLVTGNARGPHGGVMVTAPDGTVYESMPSGFWDKLASLLSPVTTVATPIANTAGNVVATTGTLGSSALKAVDSVTKLAAANPLITWLAIGGVALLVFTKTRK